MRPVMQNIGNVNFVETRHGTSLRFFGVYRVFLGCALRAEIVIKLIQKIIQNFKNQFFINFLLNFVEIFREAITQNQPQRGGIT